MVMMSMLRACVRGIGCLCGKTGVGRYYVVVLTNRRSNSSRRRGVRIFATGEGGYCRLEDMMKWVSNSSTSRRRREKNGLGARKSRRKTQLGM